MSDNWLRVIPTEPTFVPLPGKARRGQDVLTQFIAAATSRAEVRAVDHGSIVFIDAGANFETITCPWCEALIDIEWWQVRMETAARVDFTNLLTRTRCCDVTTSLNDLRYHWAQGFARWWLEVLNPDMPALSDVQLEAISIAIGHPARAVYARL